MESLCREIKNIFINLDKLDLKIMKSGLNFCFRLIIFSNIILEINLLLVHTFLLYNIGILVFKISLYLFVSFIICGIIVDGIKNKNI